MMALALQGAILQRLKSYSPLMARVTAVYDHVPQTASFPYVVIGDDTAIDFDTDDTTGAESTITIHVWSQKRGRKEAKQIQGDIYDALHRYELSVSGANFISCDFEFAETILDPDGLTRHGVIRFRVFTES